MKTPGPNNRSILFTVEQGQLKIIIMLRESPFHNWLKHELNISGKRLLDYLKEIKTEREQLKSYLLEIQKEDGGE